MVTKTQESKPELSAVDSSMTLIHHVRLEALLSNPYQPGSRLQVDEETARKFGSSIFEHGLIQIPVGRRADVPGRFEVGDGWLRLAGFKWLVANGHLEYSEMPLQVKDLSDQQMANMVMEANTVRKDLNPIELAKLYKRYLEDFGITQAELGKRHDCTQGEIANTIRLLELPAEIQQKIISQEITETHGRALLRLNKMPKLQTGLASDCIKRNMSVGDLANNVEREIWNNSKSLNPKSEHYQGTPVFDVEGCKDCGLRTWASEPYGSKKKEERCLDEKCWEKKQAEAHKQLVEETKAALKKEGVKEKILTHNDVGYGDHETLTGNTEHLDNPGECKKCEFTALYSYDLARGGKPEKICLKPSCYRAKKSKKTQETNKSLKIQDQELTAELAKVFSHVQDNPKNCMVIIARRVLPQLSADGRADIGAMFCWIPKLGNGRVDLDGLVSCLPNRSLDDLLQLTAAAAFTFGRRGNSWQQFSTELNGKQAYELAVLTGTLEKHVAAITTFQEANCRGCQNAKGHLIGTGEECCTWTRYKKLDTDGKCKGRRQNSVEQ